MVDAGEEISVHEMVVFSELGGRNRCLHDEPYGTESCDELRSSDVSDGALERRVEVGPGAEAACY
jgi:hypothetical protein